MNLWEILLAIVVDSIIVFLIILGFAWISDKMAQREAAERRQKLLDAGKPCFGKNTNVCVAEGCFNENCISDLKEKI